MTVDTKHGASKGSSSMRDDDKYNYLNEVEQENVTLKNANKKLWEQVKALGIRFGSIEKEMSKGGHTKAMEAHHIL